MSRWHRMNPEKGNQVEPDSSAHSYMQADAMRKGETVYEQFIVCPQHPDEHAKARDAVYRDQQAHGLSASNAMAVSRAISCPTCYLNNVNKAYDRKARLAEHAEHLVRIARAYVVIVGSKAVDRERAGDPTTAAIYHAARNEAEELLSKIETPEEGNKP